jgi:hypothetical protein
MIHDNKEKDRYDEYSIEIGRRIFDLQIMISRYTAELLKVFPDENAVIDAELALQIDGVYEIKNIISIFYDESVDSILISADDGFESDFGDLDVCSQLIIADSLLLKHRSDKIFSDLSDNKETH